MKRHTKMCLAVLMIFAMAAGILPENISFLSDAKAMAAVSDNTDTYLSFEDYKTAYEELPDTTSAWTLGRTDQVETMDKAVFTGDVIFSAEGNKSDCTLIIGGNYLYEAVSKSDKTACSIGLYISGGRMYAYNHYVKGGQLTEIGPAAVGYPNRVSLRFEKTVAGGWNVVYQVNGVTTEPVSYSQEVDFGPYLKIQPNADEESRTNSITCHSVQEGYTYLSFHDFRIEGVNTVADDDWARIPEQISTNLRTVTTRVNTLDKVIFQGKVTFQKDEQDFSIGGMTQTTTGESGSLSKYDHGIRIYIRNGSLYMGNYYLPHDSHTRICSAQLGTPIAVKLQFDQQQPGKWKVSYEIGGVSGEQVYTNLYPDGQGYYYDFGPQIYFRPKDSTMTIFSMAGNNPVESMAAKSFDLADGAYLVSGTAIVKDSAGQTVLTTPCTEPTIKAAGDYTVITTEGSFTREQRVSLYSIGDLNYDNKCDASDYHILAGLLKYVNDGGTESYVRPYKADCAIEYAADLNNNGKVDRHDLDLIYSVVALESITLEDIRDKYHVSGVSYDYLGGKDVMPIAGFYGPYYGPLMNNKNYNFLTDDIYLKMKELGINFINASTNELGNNSGARYVYQQLQMAEKYGIGQLISDADLNPELQKDASGKNTEVSDTEGMTLQEIAEQIGKYSFYDSYLGTHVRDEPYYYYGESGVVSEYNKQLKFYDWLAKKVNQFTNNLGFINAIASGSEYVFATSYSQGITNFRQGLEEIYNRTDARLISSTSYPFVYGLALGSGHNNCKSHSEWDNVVCGYEQWKYYYRDLWSAREVAQDKNLAFWVYTAAGGDFRDGAGTEATVEANLPTEAETYWDVNQKLAFGAKGIEWFPLLQPWHFALDSTKKDGFDYDRNGLIGLNSEITTFGGYAKEINKQIAAIDDVLMRSKSTGIMATGTATTEVVTRDGDTLKTGTNALGYIDGDTANGYGALVGCFNYGDTEAFYVVNHSLDTNQSFTLHFNKEYNYRYVSEATDYTGMGTKLTLNNIEPGRGILVVLDEEDVRYTDEADEMLQVQLEEASASGKDITFYTDRIESLYGSSARERVAFAYDTDAVFLNGQAVQPTIREVNDHGVWGFLLNMDGITLKEGDVIRMEGTIYPMSGNERGRLTKVVSKSYVWMDDAWVENLGGYYEVSLYKGENAAESYPSGKGLVFAGWFTDETCKTVYTETTGVAYAKYVNARILANLAQIPIDVKYDTNETRLRFVSTVDSLDYAQVGFTIEVEGSTKGPKDVTTKNVYQKIVTTEGGVAYTKAPEDICKASKYFFTYTLTDITNELFGRKIYVTPFWITLDGTRVCGERMAKTINMGILINAGSNNDYSGDDVINGGGG